MDKPFKPELVVNRDVAMLHPKLRPVATDLLQYLERAYETGLTKYKFELFEGFRLPQRQAYLLKQGTTKAGMWQSAHQYGLAIDLVPTIRPGRTALAAPIRGWNWDHITDEGWTFMIDTAKTFGLRAPIAWDKPHLEHPLFLEVRKAGLIS